VVVSDDFESSNMPCAFDELNACDHLSVNEISEPHENALRLIIREGRTSNVSVPIRFTGKDFGEGFPTVIDDSCATFRLEWKNYVLYQVLNESLGMPALSTKTYEGKLARKYSFSKLLQFVSETTCATDEYPGKLLHLQIICEMHVIDVISVESPLCLKSGPTSKLQ
jgi:hypothetical protein